MAFRWWTSPLALAARTLRLRAARKAPLSGEVELAARAARGALPTTTRAVALNAPQPERHPPNVAKTSKYTPVTFLPVFLFEQFVQASYMYFLVQAFLTWFPTISPFDPWGSNAALLFVLVVGGVKAALEDRQRHRADAATNARSCVVLQPDAGASSRVSWGDVTVGDIVKISDGDDVPADVLCLRTALDDGVCFVQTASLDGETNLKVRRAVPLDGVGSSGRTPGLNLAPRDDADLFRIQGVLHSEPPNANLHRFRGQLEVWRATGPVQASSSASPPAGASKATVPVTMDEVLLRGCSLRNSGCVVGLVIATGKDTRIARNMARPPFKVGVFDRFLNREIIRLMLLQAALCFAFAVVGAVWREAHMDHYYLAFDAHVQGNYANSFVYVVVNFLTFWCLFSYMVPISLFVTMEVVRFVQGKALVQLDEEMVDGENHVLARNSNLTGDLGLVSDVFCDKTGTITANQMRLRAVVLDGQSFGELGRFAEDADESDSAADVLERFDGRLGARLAAAADAPCDPSFAALEVVSLCHTLLVGDAGEFLGASPDEIAMVRAWARMGWRFEHRSSSQLLIDVFGTKHSYEILNILEFTSERQCMSVVARRPDGAIRLYMKGADSRVLPLLADAPHLRETQACLHDFALKGLRTLVLAVRDLSEDEWRAWNERYQVALGSLDDGRDERLRGCTTDVEHNLRLVGAVAVEDRLQDGVPEVLRKLTSAGMHVWMLTGDKQETAVNIGLSCGLLALPQGEQLVCNATSSEDAVARLHELTLLQGERLGTGERAELVIDGRTLSHVFGHDEAELLLARLASRSSAVVACRCAPRQKAAIVRIIKAYRSLAARRAGHVSLDQTLAIGDGANDVAMIQAAHVGVGVMGKEGRQAVNNSDFAVAQFRFLARLLLVHGTLSVHRLWRLVRYSFYKNLTFNGLLLFYQFYCGFSGQALYDSVTAAVYNVILTSLPVFLYALIDQPVNLHTLATKPHLYNTAKALSRAVFWRSVASALAHSAVCFFFTLYQAPLSQGRDDLTGVWAMGKVAFGGVLATVTLELALVTRTWTRLTALVTSLSFAAFFPILYVVPLMFTSYPEMHGQLRAVFGSARTWLVVVLCAWINCGCHVLLRVQQARFRPSPLDALAGDDGCPDEPLALADANA